MNYCVRHPQVQEQWCNECNFSRMFPAGSVQEIEVQGFKTDEDGFWLLVSPDTVRIYKGMRMREVANALAAKDKGDT